MYKYIMVYCNMNISYQLHNHNHNHVLNSFTTIQPHHSTVFFLLQYSLLTFDYTGILNYIYGAS